MTLGLGCGFEAYRVKGAWHAGRRRTRLAASNQPSAANPEVNAAAAIQAGGGSKRKSSRNGGTKSVHASAITETTATPYATRLPTPGRILWGPNNRSGGLPGVFVT